MNPYATAEELLAGLRNRTLSPVDLVDLYEHRCLDLNPRIQAIVSADFARARTAAAELDAGKQPWGPLHGLPITVKDAIHVAGLPSTGGMVDPAQCLAASDALSVQRLRSAGAVVLGKTNVPVANSDWQAVNPLFGRSLNPWNPELTPGGSTGGGAAAVAAGLTAGELGSDIGGSIRIPAAFCGLYGHKPSANLVPLSGHFPWGYEAIPAHGLAVQGPLGRSAGDLELLLDATAGPETLDARAWRIELPPPRFERLRDCRVGVLRIPAWIPVERSIRDAQRWLCDELANRGAAVAEFDPAPYFGDFDGYYRSFLRQLQAILGSRLPAATRAKAVAKLRAYRDPFLDAIADGIGGTAGMLLDELECTQRQRAQWNRVFGRFDVLLSPACSVNAFAHDDSYFYDRALTVDDERMPYYRLSAIPAIASLPGLPATVFPTGRRAATGAPIGLQVSGAYLADRSTLRFAALVSEITGGFVPPPGFPA